MEERGCRQGGYFIYNHNMLGIEACFTERASQGGYQMITRVFRPTLIALLVFMLAAPCGVFGQGSGSSKAYTQEELSQMVAPIALYPDSLLAQVLVGATFPLEIVEADRWVKQNKNLKGDQLSAATDKMQWDLSVKALVPFPAVLAMMSEKIEWTQNLGNAFLAQQQDVMNTVQSLRAKAQSAGNLKTTSEQQVIVQDKTIVIQPANPTVVYVPSYNPAVIYGAWPYPAYPPYPYYPYGGVFAAGAIGFAAGVAVGAAWNGGWGHWDWGHGSMNVNVNRNYNINSNRVTHYNQTNWNQANRNGNIARSRTQVTGTGRQGGDYRGYGNAATRGAAGQRASGRPSQGLGASASSRPSAASVQKGLQQRERGGGAFQGVGSGNQARMNSSRGFSSRQSSVSSGGASRSKARSFESPRSGGGKDFSRGGGFEGSRRGGGGFGGGGGRGGRGGRR